MIVEMKKAYLVLMRSEREASLQKLRELGVLHIEYEDRQSDDLLSMKEYYEQLRRVSQVLSDIEPAGKPERRNLSAEEITRRYQDMESERDEIRERIDALEKERAAIASWGDFDPDVAREIRDAGVPLRLLWVTKEQLKRLSKSAKFLFQVARQGSQIGVLWCDEQPPEEGRELALPRKKASEIGEEIEDAQRRLSELGSGTRELACFAPTLREEMESIDDSIQLETARLSMGEAGELTYVTGFIPVDAAETLQNGAKEAGWALLIRDPDPEDEAPTLVRNPKPVGIIQPVFSMLGTVPGYHEYDISFFFLIFLTLFFAMIIGDAGYGAVFLVTSVFALLRLKAKKRPVGREPVLLLVFGIATMVWGALSGTWFGSAAIAEAAPFRYLIMDEISSFNPASGENIKYFCFIVGTIHLLIAHFWKFIAELGRKPTIRAFSQLGWLLAVAGIYYLALNLVLDPDKYPVPTYALVFIGAGIVAVMLFSKQEGHFFRDALRGVAGFLTTFLDGISAFADIISYIRLFAVGLATVEIARSFNTMAADMGEGVVGIIGSIVILALGHTLNIAMGALSVVVHGVRLNMLEFSSHLGMEWSGIPYSPLRSGRKS